MRKAEKDKENAIRSKQEAAKENGRKRIEQAQQRIWKTSANAMLPKVSRLKAALEDQLHQNEIRSIPTEVVKPLEDELDVLKEKERLFRQVISGDFRNVSDMGEKAPLMKKAERNNKCFDYVDDAVVCGSEADGGGLAVAFMCFSLACFLAAKQLT